MAAPAPMSNVTGETNNSIEADATASRQIPASARRMPHVYATPTSAPMTLPSVAKIAPSMSSIRRAVTPR